jgi:hypothetical protein
MNGLIAQYPGELTLVSDGWSNPQGESIINYLLVTQLEAIFLKSIATGKDRHTGQYIADGLNNIIKEIGPKNIVAITTNNASNMKKSWEGIQKEYPEILCLGCGSHMINLLVKDIMKVPKLHQHFEAVKEVNQYWKNSGILNGLLKVTAKEINQKFITLQLPGKTRWQGKLYTIQSNISNIKAMQ